jgi:hypothetical protein
VQLPTAPLVGAADASHGPDTHAASSENADAGADTTRHDLDPDDTYPASHVGAHDDPIASVDEHVGPGAPFATAPEASHAHVARVKLSQPSQRCSPTKVNPSPSHAGTHVDPGASASVHVPSLPPTMNAASQLPSARIHAAGGPPTAPAEATKVPGDTSEHAGADESKPQLTYLAFHAFAALNMDTNEVTLDTFQGRTS